MKTTRNFYLPLLLIFISGATAVTARNPIVQTAYTADPAPMVYNGRLYLYTSHDEANSTWFTMNDWKLYSTADMVNWTDHGVVLRYTDFEWAKSDAWAAQCIERDGKFYMYVPVVSKNNNRPAIGVAVADSPLGPFYDPLGRPLAQNEWGDIDPSVFIDDDGQAYLYWGNPNVYYVRLNEDMISYTGDVVRVPMTEGSFGRRDNDPQRATLYEEGPWLYKRNGLYYLFWAGGPLPEHLGYSVSESPEGPWRYGGMIMSPEGGVFTNHPGVIDFNGKTYLFYHNGGLPGGGGFTRSVCVDELTFAGDGTVPEIRMNDRGITRGLTPLNPYVKNEAETIAWSEGITASENGQVGVFVTAMHDGAYIRVRNVDFREHGASRFFARVGTTHNGNVSLEVRAGAVDGRLIATVNVPRTGGSDRWALMEAETAPVTGIHDIYFLFRGNAPADIMYFDHWRFAADK